MNEVRSITRRIQLTTPPAGDVADQALLVPDGASDVQVLEWAAAVLDPESYEELRQRIVDDAHGEALGMIG